MSFENPFSNEDPNKLPAEGQNKEAPAPMHEAVAKKKGLPKSLTAKEGLAFAKIKPEKTIEVSFAETPPATIGEETAEALGLAPGMTRMEAEETFKDAENAPFKVDIAPSSGMTRKEIEAFNRKAKATKKVNRVQANYVSLDEGEIPKSLPPEEPKFQNPGDTAYMNVPGGLTKGEFEAIKEEVEKPEEIHLEVKSKDKQE